MHQVDSELLIQWQGAPVEEATLECYGTLMKCHPGVCLVGKLIVGCQDLKNHSQDNASVTSPPAPFPGTTFVVQSGHYSDTRASFANNLTLIFEPSIAWFEELEPGHRYSGQYQ
ncbi:hypothetical protein NE237_005913 [Protea cynaroides]|uniref:Uncharacterized protein n=1 Tax=Protea cynaroides TaxID=273540 RepID=A0A9Q0KLL7_9MAGN|nr:hypothetical protein NE237_005913 [Protea cynaroides]